MFFGAAAGVGKTYAMLEAGQRARRDGVDVVVGWVETHGRAETAALLEGLERLPPRETSHRGVALREFDLEAALARRPALILLDELAHTNAPGSRHAKRWQDALDLVEAGLDVYATLNVQHLESVNDLVAQITGVAVRETVPDRVLDEADELEFVDLPPDDLLRRLAEGKVYVPEQAERAVHRFFRKGNLIALRELALRRTAEHVDAHMQDYRLAHEIGPTWPVGERILVCVRPNADSARLLRAGRRLAARLRAPWTAVYVESPAQRPLSAAERDFLARAFKMAEELGAETAVLAGERVGETLVAWAREHNVSKIVAGKPLHARWRDRLRGSLLDEIVRASGEIDVFVISGDAEEVSPSRRRGAEPPGSRAGYPWAAATVLVATVLCRAMLGRFDNSNLIMVYLVGVASVAVRFGRGPSTLAAALSVAAFDFFFVPPHHTFAVADTQYLVTFAVMLGVGLLISDLAVRVRDQAEAARVREQRTQVLYAMSRELAAQRVPAEIAAAASRHVGEAVRGVAAVFLTGPGERLAPAGAQPPPFALDAREVAVAEWSFRFGRPAGRGTDTLPGSAATHVPLRGVHGTLGVLAVAVDADMAPPAVDLLEALARQVAAPLERARLGAEAEAARLGAERERVRSTLLSSVSHDLRTPLAAITGASTSLLDGSALDERARRELLETIADESRRLNRLVGNLLDITRFESGALTVNRQWQSVEEVVGSALERVGPLLDRHRVVTLLPADLPLVPVDPILLEQALVNLLENAAKYTPEGSTVTVSAQRDDGELVVEVSDDGPGLPAGAEARVFEKFYRAHPGRGGFGLGLAICRAVVEAHGGRIRAGNRAPRGACFRFTLPLAGGPAAEPVPEAADGG